MRCEILTDRDMFPRGTRMLQAMIDTAPIECVVRERYVGDCEILMVYGTGHPVRRPWQQQHVAKGGRLIGWDLGYWMRRTPDGDFRMRCTLDGDHPQAWIRPEQPGRWDDDGIALRNDYKPDGHALVIGMGPKSVRAHRLRPLEWEFNAARAVRIAHPGLRIHFKPKRPTDPALPGYPMNRRTIEEALRGASMLVCRHSNTAIDACIAGVPVVCEDGAAAALYGQNVAEPVNPTPLQRLAFLRSLAWWQYSPREASLAWTYLLDRIRYG